MKIKTQTKGLCEGLNKHLVAGIGLGQRGDLVLERGIESICGSDDAKTKSATHAAELATDFKAIILLDVANRN